MYVKNYICSYVLMIYYLASYLLLSSIVPYSFVLCTNFMLFVGNFM